MDNQKRMEKRPRPKPSKRSRSEIRRRNIQQGKPVNGSVERVVQLMPPNISTHSVGHVWTCSYYRSDLHGN